MNFSTDRRDDESWLSLSGRAIGLIAVVAGLLAAGYILVTAVFPHLFSNSETLSAENAPIFLFWSIVIIGLSIGAGYGIWKQKMAVVWGLVVIGSVLSALALFSFGAVVVPFAAFLLISAVLLTADQRSVIE